MNIADLPPPPIKPTKTPRIVKDQAKEQRYAAGASLADAHANEHSSPTQGGLWYQIGRLIEEQEKQAQRRRENFLGNVGKSESENVYETPTRKSSSKWSLVIIGVWLLFAFPGILAAFIGGFQISQDDSFNDAVYTGDSQASEIAVYNTGCLEIELPKDSYFTTMGANDCEVSFTQGYTISTPSQLVFEKNGIGTSETIFRYQNMEELFDSSPQLEIIRRFRINGAEVYEITADYLKASYVYSFWVRDFNLIDEQGDRIETVILYLSKEYEKDVTSNILSSIEFGKQ